MKNPKVNLKLKPLLFIVSVSAIFLFLVFVITSHYREETLIQKNKTIENFTIKQEKEIEDQFSSSGKAHWTHLPLSYNIVNCTDYQKNRVIKGFNKITLETGGLVTFCYNETQIDEIYENYSTDFLIVCYEDFHESFTDPTEIWYIAAESSAYISKENIIWFDLINFYGITKTTYSGGCVSYPDVEIHEILHGFGFSDNNNTNDIMNQMHIYCPSKINSYIIDELKEIYGRTNESDKM